MGRFWVISAFTLFFLVAIAVQSFMGSYGAELSHWPDAGPHVINSLLIHDYLVNHLGQPPMPVAEVFYVHYPKVSIGMWPPLYYVIAAVWMMLFGVNNTAMLLLAATAAGALASAVAVIVRRTHGGAWAIAAGLMVLAVPHIVSGYTVFLLDVPVAFAQFVAILLLVRYFEEPTLRAGLAFGVAAGLAMMTKGNAMALAVVVPLLVVLTRSWHLIRKPGLYASAVVVACVAVPWHRFSLQIYKTSALVNKLDLDFAIGRLTFAQGYLRILNEGLTLAILLAAGIGAWSVVNRSYWKGERSRSLCLLAAALSLAFSSWAFHVIVPIPGPDYRYMTTVQAGLVILAVEGLHCAGRWLAAAVPAMRPIAAPVLGALCLVVFAAAADHAKAVKSLGMAQVEAMLRKNYPEAGTYFVCSDANGEGALITETAFHDTPRPKRIVLRGTKFLSDNTWSETVYKPVLTKPDEILQFLSDYRVDFVVVDRTESKWAQDRSVLLAALSQAKPGSWKLYFEGTPLGSSRDFAVYQQILPPMSAGGKIRVPVRHTIGRELEIDRK